MVPVAFGIATDPVENDQERTVCVCGGFISENLQIRTGEKETAGAQG
jgi:hypothetical protein